MKTTGLFPGRTMLNSDKSLFWDKSSVMILLRNFIENVKMKSKKKFIKKHQENEIILMF